MKRITVFVACIVMSALCSHSIAQSRARVVSQSTLNANRQIALKLKATLEGQRTQVFSVVVSPDGRLVATTDEDALKVWTTSGQLLYTMEREVPVFSPDGRELLTVDGKNANLWDAITGKLKRTFAGHDMNISTACFSPDGSKLATGSEDGTVKLWDTATGLVSTTLILKRVKKLPRYRIFSRITYTPLRVYVKFSPDGKFLATNNVEYAAGDMVKLWDAATGTLIKEFKDVFSIMEFSSDSKWFGFIEIGADVGILDLEFLNIRPTSDVDQAFLNQHAFSPDSRMYVTGSGDTKYYATLVDISTGRAMRKIQLRCDWGFDIISEYQKDVDILSFHPSSKFLMGANHKSVRMWDVSTGAKVWETTEGRDPAEFSLDGKLLVTVGKDKKTVLLWEVVGG